MLKYGFGRYGFLSVFLSVFFSSISWIRMEDGQIMDVEYWPPV